MHCRTRLSTPLGGTSDGGGRSNRDSEADEGLVVYYVGGSHEYPLLPIEGADIDCSTKSAPPSPDRPVTHQGGAGQRCPPPLNPGSATSASVSWSLPEGTTGGSATRFGSDSAGIGSAGAIADSAGSGGT
jgi:hypothetical protein